MEGLPDGCVGGALSEGGCGCGYEDSEGLEQHWEGKLEDAGNEGLRKSLFI